MHATNHSSVTRYQSRTLHGVWTLVLLMFVMAVETSVSLVFCPTLERTVDGHHFSSQVSDNAANHLCLLKSAHTQASTLTRSLLL